MDTLNSDLLRTFLAVAQTGSMTAAGARVLRSQSATSLQVARLEAVLGHSLFRRHGRGVLLSSAGERLLPVAQEVIEKLDATQRAFAFAGVSGTLRLGIPDDQGQATLSRIIGEFARSHPLVELDVTCADGYGFAAQLAAGELDLAVYECANPKPGEAVLRRERTCWYMANGADLMDRASVPVALFDRDCWWRDAALAALGRMGRNFHVVFSSQSVSGVAGAIEAGVAIGLLGEASATTGMKPVPQDGGPGETPVSTIVMARRTGQGPEPVSAMESAIRAAYGV